MISVWQLAADHTVGGQNRTADGNGSLILHSAVGRDSNRLADAETIAVSSNSAVGRDSNRLGVGETIAVSSNSAVKYQATVTVGGAVLTTNSVIGG